jgi:putative heme-binding domain-containing protein
LTDVLEDADGSLLFVDMGAWFTYGFPGNPLAKPDALGAIYRIRRTDAKPVLDPWGKALKIADRAPLKLAELLNEPRFKVREQAIDALVKKGDAAVPVLAAILRERGIHAEGARRDATWALGRIGTFAARSALHRALDDPAVSVRLAAVHMFGLERDGDAAADIAPFSTDGNLTLRRKAIESLGRIGKAESVPRLLAALRNDADPFLEHSIIYAMIRIDDRDSTIAALADANPRVRRAGLLALDQMPNGRLAPGEVALFLNDPDADLQRTALEVICRRPAWSELTRETLRAWLDRDPRSETQNRALSDALLAHVRDPGIQQLSADELSSPTTSQATRLLILRVLSKVSLDPFPPPLADALRTLLEDSDPSVRSAAIAAVRSRELPQLDGPLVELSRRVDAPIDQRIAALECVAGRLATLDASSCKLLTDQLSTRTDPLVRLAAARTLAAAKLTSPQLIQLAEATARFDANVLRLLLPTFAKSADAEVGSALVDGLRRSSSAEVLNLTDLDRTLKNYPANVQERAKPLRDAIEARQRGKADYLARLKSELDALHGDADVGQEIFLSSKVGCVGCHRAVGRGGTIGPDLSRIGQIRTQAELLESLIFPDLTIAPEFRSFQVATKDGRTVTGLIVADSGDAISLRATDLSETRVPRAEIDEIVPSTLSLMPEGLEKSMTRQELRDLLEFLVRQQ